MKYHVLWENKQLILLLLNKHSVVINPCVQCPIFDGVCLFKFEINQINKVSPADNWFYRRDVFFIVRESHVEENRVFIKRNVRLISAQR